MIVCRFRNRVLCTAYLYFSKHTARPSVFQGPWSFISSSIAPLEALILVQLAVACEDRVLRVFRVEDVSTKHFNFKRRELARDLVDVAFGAGGDLFVLSKVCPVSSRQAVPTMSPQAVRD